MTGREAHRRSSEILVVWDREKPSRSPRLEIDPWWTEFSNIYIYIYIYIFFWVHVLSQIWVCVCDSVNLCLWICVWKENSFFFSFFFKDCMAQQWRTQRRRWVLLQVSWHSSSLQTIYGGFYVYMSNTKYKKRQCQKLFQYSVMLLYVYLKISLHKHTHTQPYFVSVRVVLIFIL